MLANNQEFNGNDSVARIEKAETSVQYNRFPSAHEKGGFHMNKERDEKIREIFKSILKKIGKKILEGRIFDVMKISKPVQMCHPLGFLETVAYDYIYFPKYLKLAANETDPIKRLKYVITAHVAGYHKNCSVLKNKAPLDAFLGETYQGKKSDGTQIYVEQTSTNPPKSSYLMIGPDELYKLYGNGEITAHLSGMNTLFGNKIGKSIVKFKDNTEIQLTNPSMEISGLLMGDRVLNYVKTVFFVDKTNQLMGELTFNQQNQSKIGKITSAVGRLFSKKNETKPVLPDFFTIVIYVYNKSEHKNDHKTEHMDVKKVPVCEGSGSWLEYIEFNGEMFWKISDEIESWENDTKNLLPSHCHFREDFKCLKENDVERADREKNKLEEQEHEMEKLRKKK